MKKNFLKISQAFVLTLIVTTAVAQEDKPFFNPMDKPHHLGINTQIVLDRLFDPSYTTPLEIIYKKQKAKNKANRFGIQLYYDHDNERPYPIANPDWNTIETDLIAGVFFGKEKQYFIGSSQRWQWYYGADINLTFTYNKRYVNDGDPTDEYDNTNYYKYGIALKPFIGVRFEITPKIYISSDMIMSIQYQYQDIQVERKFTSGNAVRSYSSNQFVDARFYPFTRIAAFIKL